MQPLQQEYVTSAIANLDHLFSCSDIHAGYTCNGKALLMFVRAIKPVFKTYVPVHIVPFLLFKRKRFLKNPVGELLKLLFGILRSILFGAAYYSCLKRSSCLFYGDSTLDGVRLNVIAMVGGIPLIFQSRGRQAEIALFSMHKSMQTIYNMAMRRGIPIKIPSGNCVLTGLALCIICYHYFNNKQAIKQSYQGLMDKLLSDC